MNKFTTLLGAVSLFALSAPVAVSASASDILPVDVTRDVIAQEKPKEAPKDKPAKEAGKKKDTKDAKKADKKDKKKAKKKKPKFKKYADVITDKAITKKGVFTTHMVDGKVYFEIPEDQIGREFVWQVKVAGIQTLKGVISRDSARAYVLFERHGDKLLLRSRDYRILVDQEEPEASVVNASDLDAILTSLPIVTFGKDGDKKVPVVDVTSIFMGGVKELNGMWQGKMDKKSSLVKNVKAFERNIETRVLGKFSVKPRGAKKPENVTAEIRHSIHALPDVPMKPRHYDKRVGYFDGRYTDFSAEKNKVDTKRFIRRWRLEKKDPTAALSEPVKPITWYIDRGTPKKYIEATREGIEFWQSAFEQAGFKNAIVAKMAPTVEEDPDWDPEDARYAVVRWVPSNIPNAQGPHVADPRSGEIIEADVRMYHNVIKLLEEWYFAQAGATDPRAKKLPLPDDVMADLVRFVVAHEVGHSIGLHHNFVGSNAYTVEQLRDPKFVAKHGVATSIMDYARFNYVIQPEDGVSPIDYIAGPYDKFAIEWGYKEFAGNLSAEEEVKHLNKIADRQLTDKFLRWDSYSDGARFDPRIQTEDIGNDAMQATALGLKNLERIMGNLMDATLFEDGKGYDELANGFRVLLSQYNREIGHVTKYVGGVVYRRELAQEHDDQQVYSVYPIAKQKEAMAFLKDHAFNLPAFWKNDDIIKRLGADSYLSNVTRVGRRALSRLTSSYLMDNQFKVEAAGFEIYHPIAIMDDLKDAVFTELSQRKPKVDAYRRNLQGYMVEQLIKGMDAANGSMDYKALVRGNLLDLEGKLKKAALKAKGTMTGMHFANLAAQIEDAMDKD